MRLPAFALTLCAGVAAAAEARVVVIQPLGEVEPELLQVVAKAVASQVAAEVRVAPTRALPQVAWFAPRKRWRAEKLLEVLDAEAAQGTWRIIGVTSAEISTTKEAIYDWGIAGLGSLGGPSCVVSTFLYAKHSKTRAALRRRFADVVVHELGHTLGMPHCEVKGCVMADAKGKAISSADASSGAYCASCRALAPKGALEPGP